MACHLASVRRLFQSSCQTNQSPFQFISFCCSGAPSQGEESFNDEMLYKERESAVASQSKEGDSCEKDEAMQRTTLGGEATANKEDNVQVSTYGMVALTSSLAVLADSENCNNSSVPDAISANVISRLPSYESEVSEPNGDNRFDDSFHLALVERANDVYVLTESDISQQSIEKIPPGPIGDVGEAGGTDSCQNGDFYLALDSAVVVSPPGAGYEIASDVQAATVPHIVSPSELNEFSQEEGNLQGYPSSKEKDASGECSSREISDDNVVEGSFDRKASDISMSENDEVKVDDGLSLFELMLNDMNERKCFDSLGPGNKSEASGAVEMVTVAPFVFSEPVLSDNDVVFGSVTPGIFGRMPDVVHDKNSKLAGLLDLERGLIVKEQVGGSPENMVVAFELLPSMKDDSIIEVVTDLEIGGQSGTLSHDSRPDSTDIAKHITFVPEKNSEGDADPLEYSNNPLRQASSKGGSLSATTTAVAPDPNDDVAAFHLLSMLSASGETKNLNLLSVAVGDGMEGSEMKNCNQGKKLAESYECANLDDVIDLEQGFASQIEASEKNRHKEGIKNDRSDECVDLNISITQEKNDHSFKVCRPPLAIAVIDFSTQNRAEDESVFTDDQDNHWDEELGQQSKNSQKDEDIKNPLRNQLWILCSRECFSEQLVNRKKRNLGIFTLMIFSASVLGVTVLLRNNLTNSVIVNDSNSSVSVSAGRNNDFKSRNGSWGLGRFNGGAIHSKPTHPNIFGNWHSSSTAGTDESSSSKIDAVSTNSVIVNDNNSNENISAGGNNYLNDRNGSWGLGRFNGGAIHSEPNHPNIFGDWHSISTAGTNESSSSKTSATSDNLSGNNSAVPLPGVS